jgi:hypothetical protein
LAAKFASKHVNPVNVIFIRPFALWPKGQWSRTAKHGMR